MLVVPLQQAVLEAAQLEEVVLLLDRLDRALVDRAQVAGQQVVVGVVELTRHAVLAAVETELDVAGVVAGLQQLLDGDAVALLGRADEVVVGDVQPLPRLDEGGGDRIGELLRRQVRVGGRVLDLEAVLVRAREEEHVVAGEAVPAGEGVRDDRRVRVRQVGLAFT